MTSKNRCIAAGVRVRSEEAATVFVHGEGKGAHNQTPVKNSMPVPPQTLVLNALNGSDPEMLEFSSLVTDST
eukprot:1191878-Rhodomonas_salina.2